MTQIGIIGGGNISETHARAARDIEGVKIASIGPITSATARECGLTVDVEANPHTIDGLVTALV
jgi:uroporphyrinogen III methyltransferase/synthase